MPNIALSWLLNFCGSWFVFSGFVKAMDPLGTAYKMEQYFAQFETTFSETAFSFIAPIFPFLSAYQNGFSVFMIILEIVLGLALIIGWKPKFSAWLFFIIMIFFTFLTGFTHLTGYVPTDANFFDFAAWGKFDERQMRVTDCGCFGDFLKLKPYTSFLKDCGLMIPAFIFLFTTNKFHRLWSSAGRSIFLALTSVGLLIYCMSNYVWNIPGTDFRPFAVGVNVAESKAAQEEAMANTEILNYIVTNKESGETLTVPYEQYLKEFRNYPKEEWELEQDVSEPAIPINKISEFEVSDADGNDATEQLLDTEGTVMWIIAYNVKDSRGTEAVTIVDTTFVMDTIRVEGTDEAQIVKRVDRVDTREENRSVYTFDADYLRRWTETVVPVANAAVAGGAKVYAVTSPSDPVKLEALQTAIGADFPIYTADDILLKTIIRSNPGVVLLKNGVIENKWHYKKLPAAGELGF